MANARLSDDRRTEIEEALLEERSVIRKLEDRIAEVGGELKHQKKELEVRGHRVADLISEYLLPEQTCVRCGVVRALCEDVWRDDATCPDCAAKQAREGSAET